MDELIDALNELVSNFQSGQYPHVITEDSPLITDWIMVVLTALGIAATGLIALLTFRANKTANDSQKESTRASIAAAESNRLAVEAMQAAVEASQRAIELQVSAAADVANRRGSGSREESNGVRWKIAGGGSKGRGFALVNDGSETAYAVQMEELGGFNDAVFSITDPFDLDPGAEIPFFIERSIASPPVTVILITWRNAAGENFASSRLVR
ncbi:hypothetical protein [Rathayibacter sp. AY1A4]|uniref:hypothetical protein n=1 Tax=Rathayibacter sp. AY1A4 TaxID=2080522 RepID=UPI0011B08BD0|nr:hypothetical protein [Rathayibacter sp. AY1A4]